MATGSRENPLQLLQFPFSAGIDEGNRDEIVDPGAGWAVLENGRQDHVGGYSTRNGFAALSTYRIDGTYAAAGYKLISDTTTPVCIADGQAEAYSATAGVWQQLGRVPEAACRLLGVPSMGASTYFEDADAANGYIALSWLSIYGGNASAYLAIIDQNTGATVRAPELVGTGVDLAPSLLAVQGNYFITVRYNSTGTKLQAWYLDTTSTTTINAGWVAFGASLCADTTGGYVLHSLPHASTPRVAVLYSNTSVGTSRLTLLTINISGVVETQTINTNSITPGAFALGGSPTDTLWMVWNQGTTIQTQGLSPFAITTTALAASASMMVMATGCNYLGIAANTSSAGKARIWANDTNTTYRSKMVGVKTTAATATADGAAAIVPNVGMVRKPFFYNGRYYSAFYTFDDKVATTSQHSFIVCDWTEILTFVRPIANPAPGLAQPGLTGQGKFLVGTTTSKYWVGMGVTRSGTADGSALCELDFASTKRWQSTAWGNSVYLSGGLASYFDGSRVAEAGFLIRPTLPTTATSATGITAVTGWRYICVYEEVDADGNWHQSGLSNPSASTGAVANKTVTVTTSPLAITSRMSTATAAARSVRVAFYRTLDGGTAPYYRLGTTINDTSATTVTFTDTTTDATLSANAKLYSQPGVLGTSQDKRPPPPFSCIASYNGMLVGASGSDVWYSGQNVSGEGVWFNPIFQVPVPGDGDITAMWTMDGTLFVAKRREVYALNGEAPSDNGAGGGLGQPRRLSVDVGCIEPRSVCTTAFGTFFQSDRGIELLTRAQSVEWIGADIQDTQAAYPVVTSATVDPASCTVLIECAASESAGLVTGSGRTLVYDLQLRKWVSTDRRTSSAGTVDAPSQSACMVYTGNAYRYAWIDSTGVAHYETTSHLDANGAIVAKRAISANVKLGGVQGWQHVNKALLLAKYHTPHDLNLSFAYDYSGTYKTARLYTASDLATITAAIPNMQLEHPMHDDARCEAVRVQLQDVTPSSGTLGTGQGATWIALAFEVVPQTGAYGLPDASR